MGQYIDNIKQQFPEANRKHRSDFIDETGKKYGKLKVLYEYFDYKNGGVQWVCQCECGEIRIVKGRYLRNKTVKSCKACSKINLKETHRKNINPGDKFNYLTYIKDVERPEGKTDKGYYGLWRCDCGKEKILNNSRVFSGNPISCGCKLGKTIKDISGQKFGKLTALYPIDTQNKRTIWRCKCDCGNEKNISIYYLTNGISQSCGCLSSKNNLNIKNILKENNIKYEEEKTFSDLKDIKLLKFDFYLPDYNCCIEYDGIQHFILRDGYWDNKNKFIIRRKHDLQKDEYCFDNKITLIRIPYNVTYNLNDLLPTTSNFIITRQTQQTYYDQFIDKKGKLINGTIYN